MNAARLQKLRASLQQRDLLVEPSVDDPVVQLLPKRFELYGPKDCPLLLITDPARHLAQRFVQCFPSADLTLLWSALADVFAVKRIAIKRHVCDDQIRSAQTELVLGSDTVVCVVENRIVYNFDICRIMFSKGNISEKLRIAQFDCRNEIVVDLFAGIGYFALVYLVHARASHVHCCELNPLSAEWLLSNARLNGVASERLTLHVGDCVQVCPRGVAQRVNLGLIPSSRLAWRTAIEALNATTGGVLHVHDTTTNVAMTTTIELSLPCFCSADNIDRCLLCAKRYLSTARLNSQTCSWLVGARQCVDQLKSIAQSIFNDCLWNVCLLKVTHVKNYAPNIDHVVYDINCVPDAIK